MTVSGISHSEPKSDRSRSSITNANFTPRQKGSSKKKWSLNSNSKKIIPFLSDKIDLSLALPLTLKRNSAVDKYDLSEPLQLSPKRNSAIDILHSPKSIIDNHDFSNSNTPTSPLYPIEIHANTFEV